MFHHQSERLAFFKFLKDSDSFQSSLDKSLSVGQFSLLPVGPWILQNKNLIDKIALYRNKYKNSFPTRFHATYESTQQWLKTQVIDNDDRFLLMCFDTGGKCIGHIGLQGITHSSFDISIDNVVRWSDNLPPDSFSKILGFIVDWVRTTVYVKNIQLKVLSDNSRAVNFYQKNLFQIVDSIPLYSHKTNSGFDLRDQPALSGQNPECNLYTMQYKEKLVDNPKTLILTAGPSVSQYESYFSLDAAKYGWNSNWSNYLDQFTSSFNEYLGVEYSLLTSSCTGALHIALQALDIGPGDEVIVPDITWVATANAVRYVGAKPIFADVCLDNWTIDPTKLDKLLTNNTKAIIPVHLYGHAADMPSIMSFAEKHNLFVIEDAAPSIGAESYGKKVGTFGHYAAFSFQGAKLMVTGEGGLLISRDLNLHLKAEKIWNQGRNSQSPKQFWIDEKGLKYKLSNLQAAFGLGQLLRINTLIEYKRRIFSWYNEFLSQSDLLYLNYEPPNSKSIYWMPSIRLSDNSKVSRDELIKLLRTDNIDSRAVFPAISTYPIWDTQTTANINSRLLAESCLNLPSGVCITRETVRYVSEKIVHHITG